MAIRNIRRTILCTAIFLSTVALAQEGRRAQSVPPNLLPYDLLLRGGHLLDDKNKIDAVRDVGIKDAEQFADFLLNEVLAWSRDGTQPRQEDDITMLVIDIHGMRP